jgi:hypothetical protein
MTRPLHVVALTLLIGGATLTSTWAQKPAAAVESGVSGIANPGSDPLPPLDPGGAAYPDPSAIPIHPDTFNTKPLVSEKEFARMISGPQSGRQAVKELIAYRRVVERLRSAKDDKEKAELMRILKEQLEQSFSHDMERREQQLSEIEERVKKLREQIEKRKKAKDDIISLRLKTFANEAEGLGFPDFFPWLLTPKVGPVNHQPDAARGPEQHKAPDPDSYLPQRERT